MNRTIATGVVAGIVLLSWSVAPNLRAEEKAERREASDDAAQDGFTRTFGEEAGDLVSTGRNPYFVLEPGWVQVLEGKDEGEKVRLVITVLDETKVVDGVETRVVEERETVDGEVEEISLNYFAISRRTNNVYYFGEATKDYADGKVKSTAGSWESGKEGAHYGLMLAAVPLLGAKYYQEIAPGHAMDRAEVVSLSETMTTPSGDYGACLKTVESSPLEPGVKESKYYAAGVGLLKDGGLRLVSAGMGEPAQ